MKKRNDHYFEVSDVNHQDDLPPEAWKVRPCEWYKEEYKDCKSIRARFHQYFVYGEVVDCSQWNSDLKNCLQFRKKKDVESLESVIESENERQQKREKAMQENDIWEYRTSPPETWNSVLPDWMLENKKNSILIETQNMLNQGVEPTPMFTGFSCCIM